MRAALVAPLFPEEAADCQGSLPIGGHDALALVCPAEVRVADPPHELTEQPLLALL